MTLSLAGIWTHDLFCTKLMCYQVSYPGLHKVAWNKWKEKRKNICYYFHWKETQKLTMSIWSIFRRVRLTSRWWGWGVAILWDPRELSICCLFGWFQSKTDEKHKKSKKSTEKRQFYVPLRKSTSFCMSTSFKE